MARSRKNHESDFLPILCLLVFLVGLAGYVAIHANPFILVPIVGAAIALLIWRLRRPSHLRASALARVDQIITQHLEQLTRQRVRLVRDDPYGKQLFEKWNEHAEYFVKEHIAPKLPAEEQSALTRQGISLRRIVEARVEVALASAPPYQTFSSNLTPSEFEHFCAEQLRMSGWIARVTQGSRDQGVDVVAEKAGIRVVLQCKLYSNPVGNKAVQEITAGKAFERAHYGAVVTNNRYTPAAEQLATSTGVFLLHHSELISLEYKLGLSQPPPLPATTGIAVPR